MKNEPIAFFSYVHENDVQDRGKLTQWRKLLEMEVWAQTGDEFKIFQDKNDISWGQNWHECIEQSLERVAFLIAIITPSYLKSQACRYELECFIAKEKKLKRNNLIFPLLYIDTPALEDKKDIVAVEISKHQWIDWKDLRHEPLSSSKARKRLEIVAKQIQKAIDSNETKRKPSQYLGHIPNSAVMDKSKNAQIKKTTHNSLSIINVLHEERVIVSGKINAFRPYKTKSNKSMAFLTLEDAVGTIEVVLFPRVWEETNALIKLGAEVTIDGIADAVVYQFPKVIANSLYYTESLNIIETEKKIEKAPLEFKRNNPDDNLSSRQITIVIKPPRDNRDFIKQIYGILKAHTGRDRFSFQIIESGKSRLVDFPNDTTNIDAKMLNHLKIVMGGENWQVEEIDYS